MEALDLPLLRVSPSGGGFHLQVSSVVTDAVVTSAHPIRSMPPTSVVAARSLANEIQEAAIPKVVAISLQEVDLPETEGGSQGGDEGDEAPKKKTVKYDEVEPIVPRPTINKNVKVAGPGSQVAYSEGRSTTAPAHTWDGMYALSATTSISEADLVELSRFYNFPSTVSTLAAIGGEHVSCPQFKGFYGVNVEMLRYGVRFPVHPFINDFLIHFNRAPGQLLPKAWLAIVGFFIRM